MTHNIEGAKLVQVRVVSGKRWQSLCQLSFCTGSCVTQHALKVAKRVSAHAEQVARRIANLHNPLLLEPILPLSPGGRVTAGKRGAERTRSTSHWHCSMHIQKQSFHCLVRVE